MSCKSNITTEEFIRRAILIHVNKYDYSLVNYISQKYKVKIICPIHGIFEQYPTCHINNVAGCSKCSNNKKRTNGEFIEKSIIIHNNFYDYSLVDYINCTTKVKIICPIHGVFEQIPGHHIRGRGCRKCAGTKKLTNEEFIEKSIQKHGLYYDYSLVEYIKSCIKVKIICPIHGIFEMTPNHHLRGICCPFCRESKGEKIIDNYLKSNNISYIRQMMFDKCRNILPLPFDFYLPELNTCIEYDGIQHFKSIEFFGGKDALKENKKRDKIKNDYCKNNNINLLRIKYTDDVNKKLKMIK